MIGQSNISRYFAGLETVVECVVQVAQGATREPRAVLIGGCSRSGKTWLANKLQTRVRALGFSSLTVGLDAWIISLDKRPPKSTVLERYDCEGVVRAVKELLKGQPIFPPMYAPVSRRRIREKSRWPVRAVSGIILLEGVIALAVASLRCQSSLNIFVTAPDAVRQARLSQLYREVKGLDGKTAEEVIQAREVEEVKFISGTVEWADIIVGGGCAL